MYLSVVLSLIIKNLFGVQCFKLENQRVVFKIQCSKQLVFAVFFLLFFNGCYVVK